MKIIVITFEAVMITMAVVAITAAVVTGVMV